MAVLGVTRACVVSFISSVHGPSGCPPRAAGPETLLQQGGASWSSGGALLASTVVHNDMHVAHRAWQESSRLYSRRPDRRDAQAVVLPGTSRHPLLLSKGRHPGLHPGDVRVPGGAPRPQEV